MSADTNQATAIANEQKPQSDKELNFRRQEQMYQKMLQEKEARIAEIERKLNERPVYNDSDDDRDDDPYVDRRKLKKELSNFEQKNRQDTQKEIQNAVSQALTEERRQQWLRANPDFNQIMQHAQTFAEKDPELAEAILDMPDTFERQKLVYKNIKALGIHKPPEDKNSIQDKVDAQRRNPGYQPSGVGSAPYGVFNLGRHVGKAEGEQALSKMRELQQRIRL